MKTAILLILITAVSIVASISVTVLLERKVEMLTGATQNFNMFSGGVTNTNVWVANASSTTVLNVNRNRQYAMMTNVGTSTAWMWFNTSTDSVVANKGVRLFPNATTSSSFEINANNLYTGAVQFTASGGDTLISVIYK